MTDKPARLGQPSPRQLVARILEAPELVAAVRALPARTLGKLIDHVGLEDSGDLVALASTEQLRQIFDEDLWRSERPGRDETFDAARFALWLEVMLEAGEEFAAAKLAELPEELVTLALHREILVINADELAVEMADPTRDYTLLNKALDSCLYQELGEYQLISRVNEGWDALLSVVLALDRDHHDLLQRILRRCCLLSAEQIDEGGGLQRVLSSDETLEADLAADREDRRAGEGFIAPSGAASFLALARSGPLEAIVAAPRDAVAGAYFRELGRRTAPPARRPVSRHAPAPQPVGAAAARPAATAAEAVGVSRLVELLREAEVLPEAQPAALLGAGAAAPRALETLLGQALLELLSRDAGAYAGRMEELAFLANVLLAGCSVAGRRLRPFEAAEVAVASCSLGLEHQLQRGAGDAAGLLVRESADRLFKIGWHLIHQRVGLAAARALEAAIRRRPADRAGAPALQRVAEALRSAVGAGKPWLARRRLELLDEVFDEDTLATLRLLLDECPTLGGSLGGGRGDLGLIDSQASLRRVEAFLEEL